LWNWRKALRTLSLAAIVLIVSFLARSASAETSDSSRLTQEMVHVAQAMAGVSAVLLIGLSLHQNESSMGTYAKNIAQANVALVKKMRPPKEAQELHKQLLELAEDFSLAVEYYVKGDFKNLNVARQETQQAGERVKQEVRKMEEAGFIPRQRL
jgi:hypothetical protein